MVTRWRLLNARPALDLLEEGDGLGRDGGGSQQNATHRVPGRGRPGTVPTAAWVGIQTRTHWSSAGQNAPRRVEDCTGKGGAPKLFPVHTQGGGRGEKPPRVLGVCPAPLPKSCGTQGNSLNSKSPAPHLPTNNLLHPAASEQMATVLPGHPGPACLCPALTNAEQGPRGTALCPLGQEPCPLQVRSPPCTRPSGRAGFIFGG